MLVRNFTVTGTVLSLLIVATVHPAYAAADKTKRTSIKNNTGAAANDLHLEFSTRQGVKPVLKRDVDGDGKMESHPASTGGDKSTKAGWAQGDFGKDVPDQGVVHIDHEDGVIKDKSYWTLNGVDVGGLVTLGTMDINYGLGSSQDAWVVLSNTQDIPIIYHDLQMFTQNRLEYFNTDQVFVPTGQPVLPEMIPTELVELSLRGCQNCLATDPTINVSTVGLFGNVTLADANGIGPVRDPGSLFHPGSEPFLGWLLAPGEEVRIPLPPTDPHAGYQLALATATAAFDDPASPYAGAFPVAVASRFLLTVPSDLNQDGTVDAADAASLFAAWGTADSLADLNRDGMVDAADAGEMFSAWTADGIPVANSVPEPVLSLPVLAACLLPLLRRRSSVTI